MGAIKYADMADHDMFAVLGTLFGDAISVRFLLEDFGAEQAYLPPFAAPLPPERYWRQVCKEISLGRFPGDLDTLIDCALQQYPYNDLLRSFRDLPHQDSPAAKGPAGLRILLLLSEPTDLGRAGLTQELGLIQEIIDTAAVNVSLTVNAAVSPTTVLPAVLDVRPHLVHFAGHGAVSGELAAQDSSGRAAAIHVTAITRLLTDMESVHTLLLGACHVGAVVGDATRRFTVIGCEGPVPGAAARAFSRGFYNALVRGGRGPEEWFNYGSHQVELEGGDASVFRLWPPAASRDNPALA